MKTIVTLLAGVLLLSSAVHAADPEALSKAYFTMLSQQQWDEIAKLYDPASLNEFREMMSFLVEVPDDAAPRVLGSFFGSGATKTSVKALSDEAFFARFLGGVMAQGARQGELDFRKIDVLGTVIESDMLQHVVIRTHIGVGDMDLEAMEVISFKKQGDRWGLLMQGKIKGLAQRIKTVLQNKPM